MSQATVASKMGHTQQTKHMNAVLMHSWSNMQITSSLSVLTVWSLSKSSFSRSMSFSCFSASSALHCQATCCRKNMPCQLDAARQVSMHSRSLKHEDHEPLQCLPSPESSPFAAITHHFWTQTSGRHAGLGQCPCVSNHVR